MNAIFGRRRSIQPGQGELACPKCENLIDGICSKASVADAYATGIKGAGAEFCSHYINPEWAEWGDDEDDEDDDEEAA